jgi:hypothetical protein
VQIFRQIAVGIYLVIFGLACCVALYFLTVGVTKTDASSALVNSPDGPQPLISADSITEASESLFLFISSPTAKQCARFVQQSAEHDESLEAFVLQRVPQNVQVRYSRSDATPHPAVSSHVHWFELEFEQERRRFDVAIYLTSDGYKIDWREFHDAYSASAPEVAGRFVAPPAPIPGIH